MDEKPQTRTSGHILVDPEKLDIAIGTLFNMRMARGELSPDWEFTSNDIMKALRSQPMITHQSPYVQLQLALSIMDDMREHPQQPITQDTMHRRALVYPHIFDPRGKDSAQKLETSLKERGEAIMKTLAVYKIVNPKICAVLDAVPATLGRIHENQGHRWPGEAYTMLYFKMIDDALTRQPSPEQFEKDWETTGIRNKWRQAVNHIESHIGELRHAQGMARDIAEQSGRALS